MDKGNKDQDSDRKEKLKQITLHSYLTGKDRSGGPRGPTGHGETEKALTPRHEVSHPPSSREGYLVDKSGQGPGSEPRPQGTETGQSTM